MSDATNHNVVGTDGIVPSYNPEGLWKTWAIWEIYTGTVGKNRYVPKVLDHVIEPETNTRYLVKTVDPVTLIPELVPLGTNNSLGGSSTDLLFAQGPGWPSQNYRIYFDDTVFPYRMDVHTFCQIRSVRAAYVKVIWGSIYGDHEVISQVYDAGGHFVTEKVGLDLLAVEPAWQNYHIKTVRPFNTTRKFVNGDTVTILVYSEDGHLLGDTILTVVESNFLRELNAPLKYITHISLESPFLSETNPTQLNLPTNWTKSTMNLTGVVHYSNGEKLKLPVDGRKFTMRGLDQLLSSIPGHEMDMMLHYALDSSEATIHESSSFNNGINLPIRVRLIDPTLSYSVKLFAYPAWDTPTNSFKLKWWLFNLERNVYFDVTSNVQIAANSQAFNGLLFGVVQRLQVMLNLKTVFPTYKPFVHTQITEITLYGHPNDYPTPWVVKHVQTDEHTYGGNLKAMLVAPKTINLGNGLTKEEWVNQVYRNTYPIVENPEVLSSAPEPTHVTILLRGQSLEFEIDRFDQDQVLPTIVARFDTVSLLFTRRTANSDLYLSMAAMSVHQN